MKQYHDRFKQTFKHTECWEVVKGHGRWRSALESIEHQARRAAARKNQVNEIAGSSDDEEVQVQGVPIVPLHQRGGQAMTERGRDGRDAAKRKAAAVKKAESQANRGALAMEKYIEQCVEQREEMKERKISEEKRMLMFARQEANQARLSHATLTIAQVKVAPERRKTMEQLRLMLAMPETGLKPQELKRMQKSKKRMSIKLEQLTKEMLGEDGTPFDDDSEEEED